jgi:hypothetical protein
MKQLIRCLVIVSVPVLGRSYVVPDLGYVEKRQCCAKNRVSSYPYISGDTFRAIADFCYDETQIPLDPAALCDGAIIFVATHYLHYFFRDIHPNIAVRYILLTANSDCCVPVIKTNRDYFVADCTTYLDDQKIIAWFSTNVTVNHPKLFPLPLGFANAYRHEGTIALIEKAKERIGQRNFLLYMNFKSHTNARLRERVKRIFKNKSFCHYEIKRRSFSDYLYDLRQSMYVLSPEGNGLDCYRHWEVLAMGAIPIVTHSPLDVLFQDLPVLIVNDWSEITQELLIQKYEEIKNKEYAWEKLYADYWINKIMAVKNEVRNKRV